MDQNEVDHHPAVRELGPDARLAVDDAGAGVANFHHLVELRPDLVKIDATLGQGFRLARPAAIAELLIGLRAVAMGTRAARRRRIHRRG